MTAPAPDRVLLSFKKLLTVAGGWFSDRQLVRLQSTVNYLKVGRWMARHSFHFSNRVLNRRQVWDVVAREIGSRPVLYLEFGVAAGEATRYWAKALTHPQSVLHGFDSFEGMPEAGGPWTKGQYSSGGRVPEIDDARVRFFKGWFNEVLPGYVAPPHQLLFLNLDADLYTSTTCVLNHLRPYIRPGTYFYFDDFNHPEHEVRAFEEFLAQTGLKFKPVAADKTLTFVCFQCVG